MDDARAQSHADEVAEQGYTIVHDAIEPERIDALLDDVARLERELGIVPSDNSFEGRKTLRVYNLLAHGELWQQVPVHSSVLPIVERVLDPGCLVSSLSSISIGPGEIAQPIHADDQVIPLPRPHVPLVCNSMWALTDFTEANGATRLVPSSHVWDHHPDYGARYDTIAAEMPRGSVLVWPGSLWHGGGANATQETRVGIAMNYCAGWVRQQENQQLGIPRAVVAEFPKRLQQLVGYGTYNMLIGHIDKQTPSKALLARGAQGNAMIWDGG